MNPTIGAELTKKEGTLPFSKGTVPFFLLLALGCGAKPENGIVLPFIENDFPKAIAAAREAKLPVFVEVWAPW